MAGKGRDKKCERRDTVHLPPIVGSATAQASFCTQSVFHNSSVQVVVFKQVPVQLRASADSVTLLVFAAEWRAAADMDQHSRICARLMSPARGLGPQQQTHCTLLQRLTDGTDRQAQDTFIDPARHTV